MGFTIRKILRDNEGIFALDFCLVVCHHASINSSFFPCLKLSFFLVGLYITLKKIN